MRFLLINSIGRNKWGGGEKWMLLAAQGLKQLGHDVFIACFSRSIIEQKALTLGIRVLPINIYTDFSVTGYFAIKKIVQQHQIDLIIGCQNKDVRLSGLVARKLGYPVVISRQGVQLLHNSFKYRCGFKPFCDGIITNTISIKEEYDSYGWWDNDYVKVIHNGVETSNQITSTFDYTTYIKPTSSQKPFIVLSTGRITTQKGFVYLIEAAEPIIQQHPHVHFFIAGKGKLQAGLEALVKRKGLADNIHFIGFHENVTGLLNSCDLFVLPSLYEGMPNSVMEALANGVPVVCTQVNGVAELMVNQTHGLVVPPTDVSALSTAITRMLDTDLRQQMAQQGKLHVEQNFSISNMVSNLEGYLLGKLKEKKEKLAHKKFLVIQTAFIGDAILATPVVEKLARFYPAATIDVLVRKGNEGLLYNNPNIRKIIIFNKTSGKYKNLIKLIKSIRKEEYHGVINIQRYFTTGLITAFSKAKQRIGFNKNPLSFLFTHSIQHVMTSDGVDNHEVKRNLKLINHLTDQSFEMPKLYPSEKDFAKMACEDEYYCLAPTSVWFTKQYPTLKWIELINALPTNATLFLLGGPSDFDACQNIMAQATHVNIKNTAGKLSFLESAALMKGARMNFVNDSAPLHICSAVNAPVRALFCSTIPAYGYTPLSDNSLVLETSQTLSCRPCGLHGKRTCPETHFKCGDISTSQILSSI